MKEIYSERSLCFLIQCDKILLAMKKKGFGSGRWNGLGGKMLQGETIESCAVREAGEEAGIDIAVANIQKVGEIDFIFFTNSDWNQRVHVFITEKWEGEPEESEEMKPKWFDLDEIPYEEMWPEDKIWLPKILGGEKIKAKIYFKDKEGNAEKIDLDKF